MWHHGGSRFQNVGLQNYIPWQLRTPKFKLWTYSNIFRRVQQHISHQCDKYWLSSPVIQKFCLINISEQDKLCLPKLLFLWISLFPNIQNTKYCPIYYIVCIQDIIYCSTYVEKWDILQNKFKDCSAHRGQADKWVCWTLVIHPILFSAVHSTNCTVKTLL